MRWGLIGLGAAAAFALAACGEREADTPAPVTEQPPAMEAQATPKPAPAPEPDPVAEAEPAIDPFYLAIDIERYGVLIDRGLEALEVTPIAPEGWQEDEHQRAYAALKSAWRNLGYLESLMCSKELAPAEACAAFTEPAWLGSDEPLPSLEELEARMNVLAEAQGPFVEAACEIGRARTGDEMFCSVE